jgi:Mg2+-importing ATPase
VSLQGDLSAVIGITVALPYTPLGPVFGLPALPASYLAALGAVVLVYVVVADFAKRIFYRSVRT